MSVPKKRGRPTVYTEAIAAEICTRLAAGESLRAICRDAHMPPESTVREWVLDKHGQDEENGCQGFAAQYARARVLGYDSIAEEIVEIGDEPIVFDGEPNNAMVQHARLRSENRRWLLAKLAPKRYGYLVVQEVQGADGGQLITRIELIPVSPRRPEADAEAASAGEAAATPLRMLPSR